METFQFLETFKFVQGFNISTKALMFFKDYYCVAYNMTHTFVCSKRVNRLGDVPGHILEKQSMRAA